MIDSEKIKSNEQNYIIFEKELLFTKLAIKSILYLCGTRRFYYQNRQ
jgi:hypothetical protein